jgi:hypothetical protein
MTFDLVGCGLYLTRRREKRIMSEGGISSLCHCSCCERMSAASLCLTSSFRKVPPVFCTLSFFLSFFQNQPTSISSLAFDVAVGRDNVLGRRLTFIFTSQSSLDDQSSIQRDNSSYKDEESAVHEGMIIKRKITRLNL